MIKKIIGFYKTHTLSKLIGTAVAAIAAVALWTWADIYLFEDGSIWTTLPTEAVAVQRIESQGEDFRAYEFKMVSEPWTCVFAAGETKGGVFCVPTTPKAGAR